MSVRATVLAVTVAAVGGLVLGVATAPVPATSAPTAAVAAIPTSTPDLRTPDPTRPPATPVPAATAGSRPPTPTPPAVVATPPPRAAPSSFEASPRAPVVAPTLRPTPSPDPTVQPRGRGVVFFVAEGRPPVAVAAPAAVGAQTMTTRVFLRLSALRQTRSGAPDGYVNLASTMRAQLMGVSVEEPGVAIVRYRVPVGGWGIRPDQVRLVLQQLVFTATEEPEIDHVVLTQNGGAPAVIAGKTYAAPLAREDVR